MSTGSTPQHLLEEHEVEPPVELETDLAEMRHAFEFEPLVERD